MSNGSDQELFGNNFHDRNVVVYFKCGQYSQLFGVPNLDCLVLARSDESILSQSRAVINGALVPL